MPEPPCSAGPALKGSPGTPSPGPEQPPGNLAAALVPASCCVPAGDRRAALDGPVALPPERRPGTRSPASSALPAPRAPRRRHRTVTVGPPSRGQRCGRLAKWYHAHPWRVTKQTTFPLGATVPSCRLGHPVAAWQGRPDFNILLNDGHWIHLRTVLRGKQLCVEGRARAPRGAQPDGTKGSKASSLPPAPACPRPPAPKLQARTRPSLLVRKAALSAPSPPGLPTRASAPHLLDHMHLPQVPGIPWLRRGTFPTHSPLRPLSVQPSALSFWPRPAVTLTPKDRL